MKLEGHKEIYQAAFDAAAVQLTEINAEFEKLRKRKEQVEKLVAVFRQYFGEEENAGPVLLAENATHEATMTGAATSNEASSEPQTVPSDPFQRRIDHVLGIGAGIRDVRKYSRQF